MEPGKGLGAEGGGPETENLEVALWGGEKEELVFGGALDTLRSDWLSKSFQSEIL